MKEYRFNGSVSVWGRVFAYKWSANTTAVSPEKAMSNLKYRFRKQYNIISTAPIQLVGKLEEAV